MSEHCLPGKHLAQIKALHFSHLEVLETCFENVIFNRHVLLKVVEEA